MYNSTCPHQYEPSGFIGFTGIKSFDHDETYNVGDFEAGSYRVAVAASHIRSEGSQTQDMEASRQLQAMQRSSSLASNLIPTQSEQFRVHGSRCGMLGSSILSQPQIVTPGRSSGLVLTGTPPIRGTGIVTDWKSRRQRNVTPSKMAELIVHAWGIEIHNEGLQHILDTDHLRKNNIKRLDPGTAVRCECASEHEEDAMVSLRLLEGCTVLGKHAARNRLAKLTLADIVPPLRALATR